MEGLAGTAATFVQSYGYIGLALALGLGKLGVPLPAEILLPLAGLAVSQHQLRAPRLILILVTAQMVGLLLSYWFVLWRTSRGEGERSGILANRQIVRLEELLRRRGSLVVLAALCLPALHGFAGYAAGLARLRLWQFAIVALAGVLIWTVGLMSVGYYAGSHIAMLYEVFHSAGLIIVLLIGLSGLIWYSRHHGG